MFSGSFNIAWLVSSFHKEKNRLKWAEHNRFFKQNTQEKRFHILLTPFPHKIIVVMLWITYKNSL